MLTVTTPIVAKPVRWRNPRNRTEIETALDTGTLFVGLTNGKWWQARRNGRTKTWKTRPADFRIPFKYGLKACDALNQDFTPEHYRIAASRDDAQSS